MRRCLTLATAFFYCALAGAGLARADEGDDLANAVVMHIRQHSAAAANLTPADEGRINSFTHYLLKTSYYPANTHDLQAAAVGAIVATPVVHEGQVAVRQQVKMTLSSDHRAIDGAQAAFFMRDLKHLIEAPMAMLLS